MNTKLALSAVAAAVALFSQAASAQTAAPAARADVKSEAATGARAKPGEATPALGASAPMSSDKTRADRKTETKAAAATGDLKPAGQIDPKAEAAARKTTSTKTREERKSETKASAKTPAGEATPAATDVPKKQ